MNIRDHLGFLSFPPPFHRRPLLLSFLTSALHPLPPSLSPLRPSSVTALSVVATLSSPPSPSVVLCSVVATLSSLPLSSPIVIVALFNVIEALSSTTSLSVDHHPPCLIGLRSTSFHISDRHPA
ncbi:hypothetical protein ACLOJK_013633 [Asimina triloba]